MKNVSNFFKNGFVYASAFAVVTLLAGCSGDNVAGGASGDAGIVAVKNREVAGVSQKGPFLAGASVAVQELDGHTFAQTGIAFRSSIKNDQGDFTIKGVNLVSQYALLEVNGYYRNEVSGEKSKGTIVLNALTDLTNRSRVNVNLLTHLMTDRIFALVQKEGKNFAEAEMQARKEVLASFGVMDDLGNGEDLDLFKGDGGALLLAMSVLMQGDGSEADLSERIAHTATAIANSGVWQGAEKAEVVDWAFQVDNELKKTKTAGNVLRQIRKNIEAWGMVDTVPLFEEYIYKFWTYEYGLGTCDEKNRYEIRNNANAQSRYYRDEFVCDYDKRWRLMQMRTISENYFEEFRDVDDGKIYKSVTIRDQQWLAENLIRKTSKWRDPQKRCYADENTNCDAYGLLYDWLSANYICPDGYSLPNDADVYHLLQIYGGEKESVARELRKADGFGAIYGGSVKAQSGFSELHESAVFWTTSQNSLWIIDSLGARIEPVYKNDPNVTVMASVRCIKKDSVKYKTGSIQDARDGKVYNYLDIDGMSLMGKNLTYSNDSASILCDTESGECLYSWTEAVNACPNGWHLPSYLEWVYFMGRHIARIEQNGTSTTFYSNTLSELRMNFSQDMVFWTSSDSSSTEGLAFFVDEDLPLGYDFTLKNVDKQNRYSVRCMKD